MSQGLFGDNEKDENEADDSEDEEGGEGGVSVRPARPEYRKTKKDKRKELETKNEVSSGIDMCMKKKSTVVNRASRHQ